jgi:hypothetical protein
MDLCRSAFSLYCGITDHNLSRHLRPAFERWVVFALRMTKRTERIERGEQVQFVSDKDLNRTNIIFDQIGRVQRSGLRFRNNVKGHKNTD